MKTIALMTILACTAGVALPPTHGGEAPRATDLLRAEKLAEQARKRLETPARHTHGWRHGGSGWGDASSAPTGPRESITINVNPTRRRGPRP
jgi:hypothetical protein